MPIDYFLPVVEEDRQPKLDKPQQDKLVIDSNMTFNEWIIATEDTRKYAIEARQLYDENKADVQVYDTADAAVEGLSKIRRPVMSQAVDSVLAQQHMASYPSDESFFKGRPKNKFTSKNLKLWEKYTEQRLSDKNFMIATYCNRKSGMLDCSCIAWHPFIRETETKKVYTHMNILGVPIPGTMKAKEKEVVTFEGTGFIPLSLEDVAFDPLTDTMDETGFIFRRWVPVDVLKELSDVFYNTDEVEPLSKTQGAMDQAKARKDETYFFRGINPTFDNKDYSLAKTHALLYEHWDDFYIDGECYENHVLIYSNDKIFHYFGPNPYDHKMKPFTISPYNPSAGTLIGKPLSRDVIPLCHVQDTLLNQSIDIISRLINPWFTYIASDETLRTFFKGGVRSIMPGEGVPVESHDAIMLRTWDLSMLEAISAQMMAIKEEIRETTGGVPYATGGTSDSQNNRTLGEVEILANGTSTRNQFFIQVYEQYTTKPFIKMYYSNDRQFMTQPVWIDDEETMLTPDMVKLMDADFDVTGSKTMANRAQDQQTIDLFLTTGLQSLATMGLLKTNGDIPEFNIPELLKRWFTGRGFQGVDQFMAVKTAQEIQEEQMAANPQAPMLGGSLQNAAQPVPQSQFAGPARNMGQAPIPAGLGGAMPDAGGGGLAGGQMPQ